MNIGLVSITQENSQIVCVKGNVQGYVRNNWIWAYYFGRIIEKKSIHSVMNERNFLTKLKHSYMFKRYHIILL